MKKKDPYPHSNPATTSHNDIDHRIALESYFDNAMGGSVEKLTNFAKYIPRQVLTRFLARTEIFKQVIDVPGSIMECGVLAGHGLMTWAQLSTIFEPVNHPCRIVGFDIFSQAGMMEDIKRSIALFDQNRPLSHIPKVSIIKGDLCETAPRYIEEHPHTVVRLLNLDANLYEPTAAALDAFLPRMPKGAIIVFDEINAENCPGETKAVMERVGLGNVTIKRLPWDTFISYAVI